MWHTIRPKNMIPYSPGCVKYYGTTPAILILTKEHEAKAVVLKEQSSSS
jgi:hypothetical protein